MIDFSRDLILPSCRPYGYSSCNLCLSISTRLGKRIDEVSFSFIFSNYSTGSFLKCKEPLISLRR